MKKAENESKAEAVAETLGYIAIWFVDALVIWLVFEPMSGRRISYWVAFGVAYFIARFRGTMFSVAKSHAKAIN